MLSLSYNHQSNGQVKDGIKSIKNTMKKCLDTKKDLDLALLLIRFISIGNGLPNTATISFNRLIRGLLPKINKMPILYDSDDGHMPYSRGNNEPVSMILKKIFHNNSSCTVRKWKSMEPWHSGEAWHQRA